MSDPRATPPTPARRAPLSSVDEVRAELRRLGYFDSGLDRFVLAPAGGESPFAACRRVALRVGLLGGALATGALLLVTLGLDRSLLAEPRDLLLLAAYLFVALGSACAALAWLAGLAAVWLRRQGRTPGPRLPRDLGLAVGFAILVWSSLWWRSHGAGTSLPMQAGALGLGLALSLLLGRFASLAAVAVLSAGGAAPELPQAGLSRRHMLPLLAGVALALGLGVALTSHLSARTPSAPDFAVLPTGVRVRVLAIDGLEARLTEQLLTRGLLPRLATLRARGAWARLAAEPEQVPAIVWTTIATGRGPEAHGIRAAGVRRLAGMRTPVLQAESPLVTALGAAADLLRLTRAQPLSAVLRSAKTFWNVASDKGLRVGIVNWWATWPADPVNGYMVTDRAVFKLDSGAPPEREVYPPEAFESLRDVLPATPEAASSASGRARRLDGFALAAARRLRGAQPPDLEAVYLPGLDIVTMQELGEAPLSDVASLDRRLEAVRSYYLQIDAWIGQAVDELGPRDVLALVGDPGRVARGGGAAAEGVLLLAGEPIAALDLGRVGARDLAPTVLHLVGLPQSRELDGRALEQALAPGFRAAHPLRQVERYGGRPPAPPASSAFDTRMVEELRSLGYIQ